jgi:DNA-binding MarR family transcriptional regulator
MITNDGHLTELQRLLRHVMRGLWARRRPTQELLELVSGDPPLGRRHVALLAQIGTEGERSVGELGRELDLSLPAASKLTRDLEDHGLVERREDPEDRRRTVVALSAGTAKRVNAWLERRSKPLEQALATLDPKEQEAFLKGLRALGDALMEESACGPQQRHHRKAHRRGAHRDRPV